MGPVKIQRVTGHARKYDASGDSKEPRTNDLVLGKGSAFDKNVGNLRMKMLCNQYVNRYDTADTKAAKKTVREELLRDFQSLHSGRVVARDESSGLYF